MIFVSTNKKEPSINKDLCTASVNEQAPDDYRCFLRGRVTFPMPRKILGMKKQISIQDFEGLLQCGNNTFPVYSECTCVYAYIHIYVDMCVYTCSHTPLTIRLTLIVIK